MRINKNDTHEYDQFLELRAVKGLSLESIAKKMKVDLQQVKTWDIELEDAVIGRRALEYEKLIEKYGITYVEKVEYTCKLYKKLQAELDKRDFSGLPTDKLYFIFMDVKKRIKEMSESHLDYFDEDDFDNFSELDGFDDKF